MTILIDVKNPKWLKDDVLYRELIPHLPGVDVRTGANPGNPEDIEMLIVSGYTPREALKYPNLKVLQKTGAGVENVLVDQDLPESLQIARSNAVSSGIEMAEFALAFVLQEQRHLRMYQQQQAQSVWATCAPLRSCETMVAVLGLGRMGSAVASCFVKNNFKVSGWSRTRKHLPDVESYTGADGLHRVLGVADYVVSVLPTTPQTQGIFNAGLFDKFKPNAIFISMGRGDQTNEPDLLQALDDGKLAGAILDVCANEPLPKGDPLWTHPKVQITPHISGWRSYVVEDIAENYRRMKAKEPLLNLVDRTIGY